MRWFAIKRSDETLDPFAECFASHTVAKTVHGGNALYSAYRLDTPPVKLLTSPDLASAKLAAENDMRAMLGKVAA